MWGRVRRGFEGARDDPQASLAAPQNLLLTLHGAASQNYFALRALDAEIAAVFATRSRAELEARLHEGQIAYGAINTVAGLSTHSALRRTTVTTPCGPVELPAPPARLKGEPAAPLRPVPAVDEHGAALRAEFAG